MYKVLSVSVYKTIHNIYYAPFAYPQKTLSPAIFFMIYKNANNSV